MSTPRRQWTPEAIAEEKARQAAEVAVGMCPYSGLTGPECKSWLCDCFEFEDIWGESQK